jgi:hypothetical protein
VEKNDGENSRKAVNGPLSIGNPNGSCANIKKFNNKKHFSILLFFSTGFPIFH